MRSLGANLYQEFPMFMIFEGLKPSFLHL